MSGSTDPQDSIIAQIIGFIIVVSGTVALLAASGTIHIPGL